MNTILFIELRGFPRFREIMEGDGSCYFRAISFAISGKQDYYRQVRETICNYIENFPGRLNAVLNTDHGVQSGREYIKKSEMRKDTTWVTEIKILATAKCFRRDVFTFYNYKWQRYSYVKSLSHGCNLFRQQGWKPLWCHIDTIERIQRNCNSAVYRSKLVKQK